jgi:2-desacetyl-2-hydroxyethyl bacteriochlorophyllide A dehydrogenase
MKALTLVQPFHFEWQEIPLTSFPEDHEVILKIKSLGICGTDYHAYRGRQPFFKYPRRLGHEIGAEIVSVGKKVDSQVYQIGTRVAIEPYMHCGQCGACKQGKSNCCESLQVLGVHMDGGMTEYLRVPAVKCHPSQTLTFDQLALIETLAIGLHAVNRADVKDTDHVWIVGAGPIGLAILEFARLKTKNISVLDISSHRLKFVENNFSVSTYMGRSIDPMTIPASQRPSILFDATGQADSMNQSVQYVSHGAKIVFVGLHQDWIYIKDTDFHRKEISLFASRNALPSEFRTIIQWMENGLINTKPWLSHQAKFDDLIHAFESWLRPASEVIKAIVHF